ncbi:MICOS subunit MIC26 [Wickerhamiella sorbophila]|uniref:MICOS complex subunit n=1 Tax=Wickerhamiella sorbophila TaxID=45607 RepID=A0A2T0FLR8_9ASCO|nr:MICOS subunit MIC26 [Wickerhamiella sorbophila]PRT55943.1 MICOS subunit MIC26 [Wickerhamiella sorbophila]
MLRKTLFSAGTVAIGAAMPMVAFADNKYKPVYDDDVKEIKNPLPGTVLPGKEVETAISKTEAKIDQALDLQVQKVSGFNIQVPEALSKYVHVTRDFVNDVTQKVEAKSSDLFSRYIQGERGLTQTIASLKAPGEDVLPNAIYILIGGLSGSIFARRSNVFVRGLAPVVVGVGAFAYFMPQTFANTRDLAWREEKEHLPQLAEAHAAAEKQVAELKNSAIDAANKSESKLRAGVNKARKVFKDWTGVNLP